MKYGTLTLNDIEMIVEQVGGLEGIEKLRRGRFVLSPPKTWKEVDGVIHLDVTTYGEEGELMLRRYEVDGYALDREATGLLLSEFYKPTERLRYKIQILKGMLLDDKDRTTERVRELAKSRFLSPPPLEVAYLLRRYFDDGELGELNLSGIIVMHDPVPLLRGQENKGLLRVVDNAGSFRHGVTSMDDRYSGGVGHEWLRSYGFAFVEKCESVL